jgi:hypothetical protein
MNGSVQITVMHPDGTKKVVTSSPSQAALSATDVGAKVSDSVAVTVQHPNGGPSHTFYSSPSK